MLTQKQLAEQLGVSQQAVSFALNGGGTLKQSTRDRIIAGAQQAGYRVNSASRLFREGKTNSLAFIVSGNFHTLPGIMLSSMRKILREKDIHLTLFGAEKDDFSDPKNPPRLVSELSADGFLVLFDGRGTTLSKQIAHYRIPSVWINQKLANNAVYPDEFAIARRAVHELAVNRSGPVLYIGPQVTPESHYSAADRRDGLRKGAEEMGSSFEVIETLPFEADPDAKHEHVAMVLRRKEYRPSIIITYGVEEAETLYIQAANLGIRVPDELIICCFSTHSSPLGYFKMTRLFVPIHVAGEEAVRMLLKRIENPGESYPSVAVDHFTLHQEPCPEAFYVASEQGLQG